MPLHEGDLESGENMKKTSYQKVAKGEGPIVTVQPAYSHYHNNSSNIDLQIDSRSNTPPLDVNGNSLAPLRPYGHYRNVSELSIDLHGVGPQSIYSNHSRNASSVDMSTEHEKPLLTSSSKELSTIELPPPIGSAWFRYIRWTLFDSYAKLWVLVILPNLITLGWFSLHFFDSLKGDMPQNIAINLATPTAVNITAAILIRNEHLVNLLFKIASALPRSSPLWLRRHFAKVYHYGGIHSACSLAATNWYLAYCTLLTYRLICGYSKDPVNITMAWSVVVLLTLMIVFSLPKMRARFHDSFEQVHRFAGWLIVALAWAQTAFGAWSMANQYHMPVWKVLLITPAFWCYIIVTLLIAYPWSRMRLRRITLSEKYSDHAIRLHFDYATPRECTTVRLSDNPLRENHSFAVIPNRGQKGFSVLISSGGDWTKKLILDPPSKIYIRGTPQLGVLYMARLFSPVLIVATGSGIGPCLGLFNGNPDLNCRILWSASRPEATFGKPVLDIVRSADPNAEIIDTKKTGRLDMAKEAYRAFKEGGCEAVVIISNPKLTLKLVNDLEIRGVPAYGPIWDS